MDVMRNIDVIISSKAADVRVKVADVGLKQSMFESKRPMYI